MAWIPCESLGHCDWGYPVGAKDASVVAFGLKNGEVIWKTAGDKISGASPALANFGGVSQILTVGRKELRGLEPITGQELWTMPTRGQSSGNIFCAGPVVFGDELLLSGWYGLGVLRLSMSRGQPQKIWHRDDFVSTHYATAIVHNGYVYGYHGHASEKRGPVLRCAKLSTGEVQWERPKDGSGTIIRSEDQLLIMKDTGELTMIMANPKRYEEVGRAQMTRRTTRIYPAIVNGLVYLKGPKHLLCVDLRMK